MPREHKGFGVTGVTLGPRSVVPFGASIYLITLSDARTRGRHAGVVTGI
jgi:hypothetical protein